MRCQKRLVMTTTGLPEPVSGVSAPSNQWPIAGVIAMTFRQSVVTISP
jgi:hypothetical protein